MTNNDPDQIRADIERTRHELASDVDAVADKVTPSKIAGRQTDKVKNAFSSVSDRVMGAASDARDSASDMSGDVADMSHRAAEKAKGNPLAVGMIAFGVGWLVASLVPASTKEKELAASVKDAAEPLVTGAQDAAKEVGENLREPAQEAVSAVKDTATDAAANVKSEASSSKDDLKDQADDARHAF